jgi:hypothetical protein
MCVRVLTPALCTVSVAGPPSRHPPCPPRRPSRCAAFASRPCPCRLLLPLCRPTSSPQAAPSLWALLTHLQQVAEVELVHISQIQVPRHHRIHVVNPVPGGRGREQKYMVSKPMRHTRADMSVIKAPWWFGLAVEPTRLYRTHFA